jgi:hypothetical protein
VKLQAGNCGAAPAQLVLTAAATQFHVFGWDFDNGLL